MTEQPDEHDAAECISPSHGIFVDFHIATPPRPLTVTPIFSQLISSPQKIGDTKLGMVIIGYIYTICATAYVNPHCVPCTTTSRSDVQRQDQRSLGRGLAPAWLRLGCAVGAQRLRREGCGVTSRVAQGHGRHSCSLCLGISCESAKSPNYMP